MAHAPLSRLSGQKETDNTNRPMGPEQAVGVFVTLALPASYTNRIPCSASALYSGFSIAGSIFSWEHAIFTGLPMASNLLPYGPGTFLPGTHPIHGLCIRSIGIGTAS